MGKLESIELHSNKMLKRIVLKSAFEIEGDVWWKLRLKKSFAQYEFG